MIGIIFAAVIMLSIYTGSNFYIAKRSFQWLSIFLPNINWKIFISIYAVIIFSVLFGFLPFPSGVKRIIGWISSHWMAIYVYLLMFILLADITLLFGSLLKLIPAPLPQNVRFLAGLIVVLLTAGFIVYGKYNAGKIHHVSYDIQTEKKRLSSDLKIVLISDLHLGAINSEKNLVNIVQGINNQKADLVCIAGDIFNDDFYSLRNPSLAIDLLKSINSTYGVYACLGNHDGGKTFTEMINFLEQSNIKLLNDEHTIIDDRLLLIGRLDPSPIGGFGGLRRKDINDIVSLGDTDLPVVVMDHNPANIGQYGNDVDLILSGHTHKGQIFPANLITKALFVVDYGYYKKHGPNVIVTSGAGTWAMPMRIGTNNKIVSIILRKTTL